MSSNDPAVRTNPKSDLFSLPTLTVDLFDPDLHRDFAPLSLQTFFLPSAIRPPKGCRPFEGVKAHIPH